MRILFLSIFAFIFLISAHLNLHASQYLAGTDTYQLDANTNINVGAPSASNFSFSFDGGLPSSSSDTNFELTTGFAYSFTRGAGSHPFIIVDAAKMAPHIILLVVMQPMILLLLLMILKWIMSYGLTISGLLSQLVFHNLKR